MCSVKRVLFLTIFSYLLVLQNALAEEAKFSGKCSQEALNAAIQDWANVPEPSEDLFYVSISSRPAKARSTTYLVRIAIYDLNEYYSFLDYVVQLKDLKSCDVVSVQMK